MAAGRLLPLLLLLLGGPGGSAGDPPSGPAALAARCRLPALTGRCRASIPRWFFNASSGSCESFVFGGCGGNGNNFGSERECRESCGDAPGTALSSPVTTNSTLADLCSAPPVTGPCRAAFPRWFYVPAEKSCREFTYGGCRGNANNHRDERECLRRCRPDGDFSDEFQRFFASKGLFLVALVALVAVLSLSLSLARGRCRPKPRAPESRRRRRRPRVPDEGAVPGLSAPKPPQITPKMAPKIHKNAPKRPRPRRRPQ